MVVKGNDISNSASAINAESRLMIKGISCPHCDEFFSDAAADWLDGYSEGRRDTLAEFDAQERDGLIRIRCELCEERSWINFFSKTAIRSR